MYFEKKTQFWIGGAAATHLWPLDAADTKLMVETRERRIMYDSCAHRLHPSKTHNCRSSRQHTISPDTVPQQYDPLGPASLLHTCKLASGYDRKRRSVFHAVSFLRNPTVTISLIFNRWTEIFLCAVKGWFMLDHVRRVQIMSVRTFFVFII